MRRGEIWWADDPDAGSRPHLVLTRDSAVPVLSGLLVVPVTRTFRGIPTEVPIGIEHGMPSEPPAPPGRAGGRIHAGPAPA